MLLEIKALFLINGTLFSIFSSNTISSTLFEVRAMLKKFSPKNCYLYP
jgi:hypothetical protein